MKLKLKRNGIVRVKAHPKRGQVLRAYKKMRLTNEKLSSSINFDQLLQDGKTSIFDVDNNGNVEVNYNNPAHRRWLED
ncbi:hypothetical protein [Halalkalibacter flavus]|uniref:hypothetical protein n=1 Tax=Halalkalibacter flavus TaxID=3090668 RepID=UPI002FCBB833